MSTRIAKLIKPGISLTNLLICRVSLSRLELYYTNGGVTAV